MEIAQNIIYIIIGVSCFYLYRSLKKKWYKKKQSDFTNAFKNKEPENKEPENKI